MDDSGQAEHVPEVRDRVPGAQESSDVRGWNASPTF